MFAIKPLKWIDTPYGDSAHATTQLGPVAVAAPIDGGPATWSYCFVRDGQMGERACSDLKDGKAQAEAFYQKRLAVTLVPLTVKPLVWQLSETVFNGTVAVHEASALCGPLFVCDYGDDGTGWGAGWFGKYTGGDVRFERTVDAAKAACEAFYCDLVRLHLVPET